MASYNSLTSEILAEIAQVTGPEHVVTDAEKLLPYSHDEAPGDRYRHLPAAVVKPASAAQVSEIMKIAARYRIPVTPRGAGTGLSAGAVPVYGGLVLSLERMNRILEYDAENMVVVVEPGVITSQINEFLAEHGVFYPGYPMSRESCTIGGNVATNAGGGRAVRYGVTGRYVLGLEAVLPTGEIINLGGKRVKDVTGYNLIPLIVGSEGTLAVVTKIILRLLPLPPCQVDLLALFDDIKKATAFACAILKDGKILPSALEFMDKNSVDLACRYLGEALPHRAQALLLIQLEGNHSTELLATCECLEELGQKHGVLEIYSAGDPASRRKLWRIREAVSEAARAFYPLQCNEDMVVPPGQVSSFVEALHRLAQKYDCEVVSFGHAGDGNIHARFLKKDTQDTATWEENLPLLLKEAYSLAAHLGGTISGEHGIGAKRKQYLGAVMTGGQIELMRRLKAAFDPLGILNPGKIFPDT